jgi:microsomal dipeptidase-like Zn-dependent dipeptidase
MMTFYCGVDFGTSNSTVAAIGRDGPLLMAPFLARGNSSTVEDYVAAIDHVIRIAGEDNVGIGTDFTQDQDDAFFEYICHDKGDGWRVTGPFGDVVNPAGMRRIGDFPNLTAAMERTGWRPKSARLWARIGCAYWPMFGVSRRLRLPN